MDVKGRETGGRRYVEEFYSAGLTSPKRHPLKGDLFWIRYAGGKARDREGLLCKCALREDSQEEQGRERDTGLGSGRSQVRCGFQGSPASARASEEPGTTAIQERLHQFLGGPRATPQSLAQSQEP